jgi:hypothetical protein
MGLKKRERPISGLVSTYTLHCGGWLRLSSSFGGRIEWSRDRLDFQEHRFSFCQERAPHALVALQDRGIIAPVHQLSKSSQQIREESAKLSIPAILRPSETTGINGGGCQSITVLVPELSMGIEAPWSIQIKH